MYKNEKYIINTKTIDDLVSIYVYWNPLIIEKIKYQGGLIPQIPPPINTPLDRTIQFLFLLLMIDHLE